MHILFNLFISETLINAATISNLTFVLGFIAIGTTVYKISKSKITKSEFENELKKKADAKLVEKIIETQNVRILNIKDSLGEHEKQNYIEFKSIKSIIEEQHATMNYILSRVDDIYKLLIKKND